MSTPLRSQFISSSNLSRRPKRYRRTMPSTVSLGPVRTSMTFEEGMTAPITPSRLASRQDTSHQNISHQHRTVPVPDTSTNSKSTGSPVPVGSAHVGPVKSLSAQLDLSQLDNFEVVEHQYQNQGIQFQNAIALYPSNPAFPPRNGGAVILGGPKSGTIDLTFSPPVQMVEGYVTSSGVTVMTAFDDQGNVIDTDETSGRNLADTNSPHLPHACLSIQTSGEQSICHIRLRCGGGQISLSGLRFSRVKG